MSRLEKNIRQLTSDGNQDKVAEILDQLCNDYAYAVHQPHARNGGLIGLAAAAIALGSVGFCRLLIASFMLTFDEELPRYLAKIVPPVLACFTDQDARVRYYACEAMYNIAKVAKGEILIYFNSIFDQLCKVSEPLQGYRSGDADEEECSSGQILSCQSRMEPSFSIG